MMKVGRLTRNDSIVADQVEIQTRADHRRKDGRESWHGEVWLTTDVLVIPGEQLRLELAGGEVEAVVVASVTVDSKAGRMLVRLNPAE